MNQAFDLPLVLPTLNKALDARVRVHTGKSRGSRRVDSYTELKKKATYSVANHVIVMKRMGRLTAMKGRVDFEFVWRQANKRVDPDNIAHGMKYIFDGLVEAGLIENDGWANIGCINHQFIVAPDDVGVTVKMSQNGPKG